MVKALKYWIIGMVLAAVVGLIVTLGYGVFLVWTKTNQFDFMNSAHYKPQEHEMRLAVGGTVPVSKEEIDLPSRVVARQLENPVPATGASVAKGRELYQTICAVCHGKKGEGQGVMGTVPALIPQSAEEEQDLSAYLGLFSENPPPDLTVSYVADLPDGDIYYTITNGGFAIMPPYRDHLTPEERWDVINYVRKGLPEDARK
ncbi:MAG: c-type cytochrome [Terriglobia bacterium]